MKKFLITLLVLIALGIGGILLLNYLVLNHLYQP